MINKIEKYKYKNKNDLDENNDYVYDECNWCLKNDIILRNVVNINYFLL